jgi:hypothetical protein
MSKLKVTCYRPLTEDERELLLALARVLPIWSFHAHFTSPDVPRAVGWVSFLRRAADSDGPQAGQLA